ncbi:MAG TPA: serine protease, partial [Pirellulales bacterium]|nr:serine protease [Pirellulales bacterium]
MAQKAIWCLVGSAIVAAVPILSCPADAAELPTRIVAGKTLTCKIVPDGRAGEFELRSGPETAKISPSGVLVWTPTKEDVGVHQFKIRLRTNGTISFLRLETTVVAAEDVPVSAGGPEGAATAVHSLTDTIRVLTFSRDAQSILVLHGTKLDVLDKDGLAVNRSYDLPRRYRSIGERESYYIALTDSSVELLDKKTLEVTKEIPLGLGAVRTLTANPAKAVSYVTLDGRTPLQGLFESQPVFELNELTGTVRKLPRVFGRETATDPSGRYLYTVVQGYLDRHEQSDRDLGVRLRSWAKVDVLFSFDVRGHFPRPMGFNARPGYHGERLAVSPDGKHLSYVSFSGTIEGRFHAAALSTGDVNRLVTGYKVGLDVLDFSYHPVLDLVGATDGKVIRFLERKTGEPSVDRLETSQDYGEIQRLLFSPGGRRLLIAGKHPEYGLLLHSAPLLLTPNERPAVDRGFHGVVPAEIRDRQYLAVTTSLPLHEMEALKEEKAQRLSSQTIARRYADAVVVVTGDRGRQTGFVVGSGGYVLTCASAVPTVTDPSVAYRAKIGDRYQWQEAKATVAHIDERRDLALLR